MQPVTIDYLAERLELADRLLVGRSAMLDPQDLPGRYGRVVAAVDHLLSVMQGESVLADGWAVWRHGYVGRITQDIDIVVAAGEMDELLRLTVVSGFDILATPAGHWPKARHKETDIQVDLLPEGGRPGTGSRPAPTTIPHPRSLGAKTGALQYITLPGLVELKLAAGRIRDDADIVELIRANPDEVDALSAHLTTVHPQYAARFDELSLRADE